MIAKNANDPTSAKADLRRALPPPNGPRLHPRSKNEYEIKNIDEFRDLIRSLRDEAKKDRLIFRGEEVGPAARGPGSPKITELRSSLQKFLDSTCGAVEIAPADAEDIALREFKRSYHRYSRYVPRDDDRIEWLATMQHHGAPTRLLDWTFSEYVALFFAIRRVRPDDTNKMHVVWVVNQTAHWNAFKRHVRARSKRLWKKLKKNDKDPEVTTWALTKPPELMAVPLSPFRQNTRLHVQQGTFMAALDLKRSFRDNLENHDDKKVPLQKIVIPISHDFLLEALTELQRINITDKSLFPDIDGLAKSTELSILLRHLHPPKWSKHGT
jgi:hypothetical protein